MKRTPEDGEYLTCPNHGERKVRLWEDPDDDSVAMCPDCNYACQNFLRYPIAEVHNHRTGERYLRDMLTGEVVDERGK